MSMESYDDSSQSTATKQLRSSMLDMTSRKSSLTLRRQPNKVATRFGRGVEFLSHVMGTDRGYMEN